jgi:hypothetical protein
VDRLVKSQPNLYNERRIARLLYLINLPLSIIAGCMFFILVIKLFVSGIDILKDNDWLGLTCLVLLGIAAEIIYYIQSRDDKAASNSFFWIYSLIVNFCFMMGYLYDLIKLPGVQFIMILYPLFFFVLSYIGLKKVILSRIKN